MDSNNRDLNRLAKLLITDGRNKLCGELPVLYRGISDLKPKETALERVFTDGNFFFYSPTIIVRESERERNAVNRLILHSLFHCIFLHVFKTSFKKRELWDLACDICVEKTICDCNLSCTAVKRQSEQVTELAKLCTKIKHFTAENVYVYLCNSDFSKSETARLTECFKADCHAAWYKSPTDQMSEKDDDTHRTHARSLYKIADNQSGEHSTVENDGTAADNPQYSENAKERWRKTTRRTVRDFETAPSVIGTSPGFDIMRFEAAARVEHDYSAFLRNFMEPNEKLQINDDEFDYIYYTYGLDLYKNIPLIEPLEYCENQAAQCLVMAIDTSGSVYGDTVKKFIKKTADILKTTEFFNKEFEIHIIQCDTEIQKTDIIHSQNELESYIDNVKLYGFGGTDFRPIFRYAQELNIQKSRNEFNGLICFTDGDGIYPEAAPTFKSAFLISDNGFDKTKMPTWATPLYYDIDLLYHKFRRMP